MASAFTHGWHSIISRPIAGAVGPALTLITVGLIVSPAAGASGAARSPHPKRSEQISSSRKGSFPLMYIMLFWITCGIAAAGFLNAHLRAEFAQSYGSACNRQQDRAFALGASLLAGPFALVLSVFLTDFWADGWTLSARPIHPRPRP
jgi:hypothetical protein